jgi:purine nucleosidase
MAAVAQASPNEKIIIDTDIGTDVDDVFAVALALRSPEFQILGIATASGDTAARAGIVDRLLGESGRTDIPVVAGPPTMLPFSIPAIGRQVEYTRNNRFAKATHSAAVDFILEQIRQYPGEVTLIAIGPLTNLGRAIERDPQLFRRLKRVVIMGGSFAPENRGGWGTFKDPTPEYNIQCDIAAAQKLFQSGVPIYVMPLDSTANLKLDEVKRDRLFSRGTPLSEALGLLYLLWGNTTPILYDAMAVAFALDPGLCPVTPMRVVVDDAGVTRSQPGPPNAQVCLRSDPDEFLRFYMARLQ